MNHVNKFLIYAVLLIYETILSARETCKISLSKKTNPKWCYNSE